MTEKTTFTRQLLWHKNVLFERPFTKIVYCYGRWQEYFKDIAGHIQFVQGIPDDIPSQFTPTCCPGIFILPVDDLMCSDDGSIYKSLTTVM